MHYTYTPKGVHSQKMEFDIEEGIVKNVKIIGGCDGNNLGMASLAEGMEATEVVKRLTGLPCGKNPTSCPDQLAKAVAQALGE